MSITGMINLTGIRSGSVSVGRITTATQPRRYELTCSNCGSSWTATHTDVQARVNAQKLYECKNDICRTGTLQAVNREEQQSREYRRRERELLAEQQEAALRAKYSQATPGSAAGSAATGGR